MPDFARRFLAWILLAFAAFLEAFWTLAGMGAITYGAFQIYIPAGWIVGGIFLFLASEDLFFPTKRNSRVSGGEHGTL